MLTRSIFDLLRHETEIVGYPILPLVHQISKQAGESGGYVHWGATIQDIMDTAVVLQIRDAFALIESDMDKLRATLADLSRRYRDTPMAGEARLTTGFARDIRLQSGHLAGYV